MPENIYKSSRSLQNFAVELRYPFPRFKREELKPDEIIKSTKEIQKWVEQVLNT